MDGSNNHLEAFRLLQIEKLQLYLGQHQNQTEISRTPKSEKVQQKGT